MSPIRMRKKDRSLWIEQREGLGVLYGIFLEPAGKRDLRVYEWSSGDEWCWAGIEMVVRAWLNSERKS